MFSTDTSAAAVADRLHDEAALSLARYASAIRSLEAHAWVGVRCQHGVSLARDCNECEPMLDHNPGFDEGFEDDRRHGLAS